MYILFYDEYGDYSLINEDTQRAFVERSISQVLLKAAQNNIYVLVGKTTTTGYANTVYQAFKNGTKHRSIVSVFTFNALPSSEAEFKDKYPEFYL